MKPASVPLVHRLRRKWTNPAVQYQVDTVLTWGLVVLGTALTVICLMAAFDGGFTR